MTAIRRGLITFLAANCLRQLAGWCYHLGCPAWWPVAKAGQPCQPVTQEACLLPGLLGSKSRSTPSSPNVRTKLAIAPAFKLSNAV